ncbi:hypothetical protein Pfo_003014 [Paulownia fortunei]|nr:hypothetical protein Pfo_003014 [Paulownia fortunei]
MQHYLIFLCFLFTFTAAANPNLIGDHISINCGSTAAASTSLSGREWLGDVYPKFSIKGSSTRSSVNRELKISVDPVPYNTARISRSQFSYTFQLNPGQKVIRLHFNPTNSYTGFQSFNDFFTVEAGPFTLLTNFSPSITARALALNTFAKEFCIIIQENQPLSLIFSPATATSPSQPTYAFINGIEIISVPSTLSYCHGGDVGVQVIGHKSVIHIDNATALEMIHRLNIKWDSVSSGDDFRGMFGMWATILKKKANKVNNITWKVSVDVGFRYLVRLHFCELGLRMAETGHKDFILIINHMIVTTSADILQQREDEGILWYKNYMVMVKGHKREGKREIFISLHSKDEFVDGHSPLEGFEIFKLSNHDNSLASPNPLPPPRDSSFETNQILLRVLGRTNAIATVVITIICLVNIIVHMLQQNWGANFTEEENKPSTKAKRLCRRFSLAEIQSATQNFNDVFVIGKGGFGKVYKGLIDNGQEAVAIKRLKLNSKQGKREFWTEIEMLSELRHVNLVSLIGYCNEQREMILVYDYMPCGTLADHLYKLARKNNACSPLSWKQRLKICIGAGRGIDYLHTGNGIIHRDIKASNILLDEKFVAKVSDFGLAKTGSGSELQSQASTNLKGTFGYFDPDYFRTRRLTTKSDTYSFGVVLLEVLCGRPAVEPWVEEDKRSLTMWARDNISKGEVDQIVAPSLRGGISPDSLKAFVRVAERCLHDEPKKRPAIANVVIKLEFALQQQENAESLVPNEITSVADDVFPYTDKAQQEKAYFLVPNEITNVAEVLPQQENAKSSVPNEITNVADATPWTAKTQQEKAKSLLPDEITNVANALPCSDRTILSLSTRQLTMASSNVQNVTSPMKEQINSKMINGGKKDGRKNAMHKLSRLWAWNAFWSTAKPSKKKDLVSISVSAPMSRRTSNMTLRGSAVSEKIIDGSNELILTPNLRIFSFSELKAATRNFSYDTVIGEGGFGRVYKGWIYGKSTAKSGSGSFIAVKKLNSESMQGLEEWQSEVNFLGRLSHPNLVKLLGYCWEDKELLLVYEFMQKGSLEIHLFTRGSAVQPLPWDTRLKILIGAARGLAFLHALNRQVIYRDFKASNILLDESYHARLSDFGLAKLGPVASNSHVSTRVMGTLGYAAPEYIATGHLYVKSDVYGFGVILVEMLTGSRALDLSRPSGQHILVDWIKPYLPKMNKLKTVMDSRLEGRYPTRSAFEIAQLALHCLKMDPKDRPSMHEIVETLERIDSAVEKPRQPRVQFSYQAANTRSQNHL